MTHLWLSYDERAEDWSVFHRINELSAALARVRFPSTTTRHPRRLHKFTKYKGSEFRLLLLCGYQIFESILKPKYYSHLLLLALTMHYVSFDRQQNSLHWT